MASNLLAMASNLLAMAPQPNKTQPYLLRRSLRAIAHTPRPSRPGERHLDSSKPPRETWEDPLPVGRPKTRNESPWCELGFTVPRHSMYAIYAYIDPHI